MFGREHKLSGNEQFIRIFPECFQASIFGLPNITV